MLIPAATTIKTDKTLQVQCCICLETFKKPEVNTTKDCTHVICNPCMHGYLEKLCHNTRYKDFEDIYCPGLKCEATFNTSDTVSKVFNNEEEKQKWWSQALQTAFIRNRVVCPFDGCHEIYDVDEDLQRKCTFTECQQCHRGFCLACSKKWHVVDQTLPITRTTEINVLAIAEKEGWSRCPKCRNMVQKANGCDHILCRCGIDFCYRCGSQYMTGICANRCHEYSPATLNNKRKPMFCLPRFSNR